MTTVPVHADAATAFCHSTQDFPVVGSAALLTAGAAVDVVLQAAVAAGDNRQHQSLPVRTPRCTRQHLDQQHQHDLDLDALLGEQQPWPERIKVKHVPLLHVPRVPIHGVRHGEGERYGKRFKPNFNDFERLSRSVVSSFLRSVALQHLNRLSLWWGVDAFGPEYVPMLVNALVVVGFESKPYYRDFWFEDEGSSLVGFQSRTQQAHYWADRGRMPLSLLRSEAEHIATVMLTPTLEPYRIEVDADRRAFLKYMTYPVGENPGRGRGVIPKADVAYFEKHGLYPPHWRLERVAFSQRQQMLADRSWKNRKKEPGLLLKLPEGLTSTEQIEELAGLGIEVKSATITRWRKQLIDNGIVARGKEPWHTGTTTAANRKKISREEDF